MIGAEYESVVRTVVDRTSCLPLLMHLLDDGTVDSVTSDGKKTLRCLLESMRLRLPWDRGVGMAEHT